MNDLLSLFKDFTITEEYPIKGYLSEISSPARLWYQTDDPILGQLDEDLNCYYEANKYSKFLEIHQDDRVIAGLKIASYICSKWHRATVLSEIRKDGNLCIFADDFGTKGYVNVKFCRYLPADFVEIPRKSIKACLSGIAPPNNAKLFDIKATECIVSFCYNRLFRIKLVKHHQEENFHEIVACRDDGKILNDYLIEAGHARPIIENTKFSVFYPPFDLVEKVPFYESYNHRYAYRNKGVNFNAFEEEFIDTNLPYEDQLLHILSDERFASIKNIFENLHSVKVGAE